MNCPQCDYPQVCPCKSCAQMRISKQIKPWIERMDDHIECVSCGFRRHVDWWENKAWEEHNNYIAKKNNKNWRSRIQHQRKRIDLGSFNSEAHAARAYNVAAEKLFGGFALKNCVDPYSKCRE